ncbi:Flagellar assembly factor FliW [compost metagenome]
MKLETRQFGSLEIEPASILTFPSGLLGFEELKRFVLLERSEIAPLEWLQSVENPQIVFTVIDPAVVFGNYQPELTSDDWAALGIPEGSPVKVRVLVTVPKDPAEMTANLLGPLVFSPDHGKGRQVVLVDSDYPVRQRLLPEPAAV